MAADRTASTSPRPTPASSGSVAPRSTIPQLRFVFGYEQALGYLVCRQPWDKDGITAAVVMAEVAALAAFEGVTLQDRLDAIAARYGRHVTTDLSVRLDPVEAAAKVAAMRAAPPTEVGGRPSRRSSGSTRPACCG